MERNYRQLPTYAADCEYRIEVCCALWVQLRYGVELPQSARCTFSICRAQFDAFANALQKHHALRATPHRKAPLTIRAFIRRLDQSPLRITRMGRKRYAGRLRLNRRLDWQDQPKRDHNTQPTNIMALIPLIHLTLPVDKSVDGRPQWCVLVSMRTPKSDFRIGDNGRLDARDSRP